MVNKICVVGVVTAFLIGCAGNSESPQPVTHKETSSLNNESANWQKFQGKKMNESLDKEIENLKSQEEE